MAALVAAPEPALPLSASWPWPFGAVQDWFEHLYQSVQGWVYSAAQRILDVLYDAASPVWSILYRFVNTSLSPLYSLFGWVADRVTDGVSWLGRQLVPLIAALSSQLTSTWDSVRAVTGDVLAGVAGTLSSWGSSIVGSVQGGVSTLMTFTRDSTAWVGDQVRGVQTWIVEEVSNPIASGFRGLGQSIGGFFVDLFRDYRDWNRRPESMQSPEEQTAQRSSAGGIWGWLFDAITGAVSNFWDGVMGFFNRFIPATPDKAAGMVPGLLSLGAVAVGGLGLMTIGGELLHPLKQLGLGNIAAMVGDVINYRVISAAIVGALVGAALTIPLRAYYNALFRPRIPEVRELDGLVAHYALVAPSQRRELAQTPEGLRQLKELNVAEYKRLGAYSGYTDETLDKLAEVAWSPPPWRILQAIARDGTYDERMFRLLLVDARYEPEVIEIMLDMLRRTAQGVVQAAGSGRALQRYSDGLTDRAGLMQELQTLGYASDKLPGLQVLADLERQTDTAAEMVTAWRSALTAQRVTEGEFRGGLQAVGIQAERIDLYILQDRVRRGALGGPTDETTLIGRYATTAINGYRDGYLSDADLRSTLAAMDYSDREISQLALRANLEATLAYAHELELAYASSYKRGVLSDVEYDAALADLGMLPDRRALVMRRDTILRTPKVSAPRPAVDREVTEAQLTRAYQGGLIDEAEYRSRLRARDYSGADVDLLVNLAAPKDTATA